MDGLTPAPAVRQLGSILLVALIVLVMIYLVNNSLSLQKLVARRTTATTTA